MTELTTEKNSNMSEPSNCVSHFYSKVFQSLIFSFSSQKIIQMAEQTTNTKDGASLRVEGVITMALNNEISWKMLDLLLEELTPTLKKSKQVIKILLKELQALSSSFQKMKAQKDSLTIETSGESEKPKDEERSESKYQETEKKHKMALIEASLKCKKKY